MIPVVNNFILDCYIGNQVVELDARLNLIEDYSITNRELVSALGEDLTYYRSVIEDQGKQIEHLTRALSIAVFNLNSLTIKKEKICTRLSEVIKSHFMLKKEVIGKFEKHDRDLSFIIVKLNSLSLN